jgi:energy-coupling factor transport system substrate-specific component
MARVWSGRASPRPCEDAGSTNGRAAGATEDAAALRAAGAPDVPGLGGPAPGPAAVGRRVAAAPGPRSRPEPGARPAPVRFLLAGGAAGAFGAAAWAALDPGRAGLSLLLVAASLVAAGVAWFELGPASTKQVALVATLAGVAAAGRILLAPVPGVQPVTVITIAAGAALGARAGAAVGALAALASNFVLGQGVWTPWQMLGWALCGLAGAGLRPALRSRLGFAAAGLVLGFAFSALMDLWEWAGFLPHTWPALAAQMARGLPFEAAHGIGNVVIALVAGPALVRTLERYARRLRVDVSWNEEVPT